MARAVKADADYVLLLNNDTVVDPGFLSALVHYAEHHPDTGIVGPLIGHLDQPDHVSSAGATIDLTFGRVRIHHFSRHRSRVPSGPYATAFVTGCCMLIPTSVIAKIGLFDEGLFAYYDDVDYCLRVRQGNLAIVCEPRSVIWHRESSSTRRGLAKDTVSPLKHYLFIRNRITIVRRHGTRRQNVSFFFLIGPSLALYYTFAFIARRRWVKLRWFWRGIRDGLQSRLGAPVG
jgi:GT2 family glycosyltransferase